MIELPKCYSEQEREDIRLRLKTEARKCLAQYGIKRTTVDELVRRVNIPKGTFYLFYQSKELLLYEVIEEEHEALEKELFQKMQELRKDTIDAAGITEIIFSIMKKAAESPGLRMLRSAEVELLYRKLPTEIVEEHLKGDQDIVGKVFEFVPIGKKINKSAFSVAFREIYFLALDKKEIDEEEWNQTLRLLINGLVVQLM